MIERKTNKEKMIRGELYKVDHVLEEEMRQCRHLIDELNLTKHMTKRHQEHILQNLFLSIGSLTLQPPFYCDYGKHIRIGENVFINYDCIFLDVNYITIGDRVFFGPRVSLYTAGHPIDAEVRGEYLEFGKPIIIGNDVWLGGNVIVNPGVTIGDNVVIGSGSVVTKDIPPNVVAVGNPCKVLRKISEKDIVLWHEQKEKYLKTLKNN